jgi:hypothetical protein
MPECTQNKANDDESGSHALNGHDAAVAVAAAAAAGFDPTHPGHFLSGAPRTSVANGIGRAGIQVGISQDEMLSQRYAVGKQLFVLDEK